MIGFEQSAWLRLGAGLLFCAAAVGLVWLVERSPDTPAAVVQAGPPGEQRRLRLAVESSYPVARWSVTVLGVAQQAESSDAVRWNGTVAVPAGEDVLVQAAAEANTGSPHRALRLHLGDAPERLVWGSGDLAATVAAP